MVLKGEPGWICLMCCNADILFSVVVLHWVTKVDRTPNLSSNHSNVRPNAVRASMAIAAAGPEVKPSPQDPQPDPEMGPQMGTTRSLRQSLKIRSQSKGMGSTMTTEIKAMPKGDRRGSDDDAVELRGIRVHTERTHEVEVDRRSEGSACGYTEERGVSAEKMV